LCKDKNSEFFSHHKINLAFNKNISNLNDNDSFNYMLEIILYFDGVKFKNNWVLHLNDYNRLFDLFLSSENFIKMLYEKLSYNYIDIAPNFNNFLEVMANSWCNNNKIYSNYDRIYQYITTYSNLLWLTLLATKFDIAGDKDHYVKFFWHFITPLIDKIHMFSAVAKKQHIATTTLNLNQLNELAYLAKNLNFCILLSDFLKNKGKIKGVIDNDDIDMLLKIDNVIFDASRQYQDHPSVKFYKNDLSLNILRADGYIDYCTKHSERLIKLSINYSTIELKRYNNYQYNTYTNNTRMQNQPKTQPQQGSLPLIKKSSVHKPFSSNS